MLSALSILLVLTIVVFASVSMVMTVRDVWGKIVAALAGYDIAPEMQRYRVSRTRRVSGRAERPSVSMRRSVVA